MATRRKVKEEPATVCYVIEVEIGRASCRERV